MPTLSFPEDNATGVILRLSGTELAALLNGKEYIVKEVTELWFDLMVERFGRFDEEDYS